MRFADHFIFLDENGGVSQKETPESVSKGMNEVQSLATLSPRPCRALFEHQQSALHELGNFEDMEPDASRRTGDIKNYPYYARMVGWPTFSFYLFACVIFVFGINFRCKFFEVPLLDTSC